MSTIEKLVSTKGENIWIISPDDSVYAAIKLMNERQVGALPVVVDEKLVGIISERDYARKVILQNRTSQDTLVKDIMTERVYHVKPTQKIDECMAIMSEYHIRHLPIVSQGKLCGMIAIGDVVKYIISDQKFKIEQLENTLSWGESY